METGLINKLPCISLVGHLSVVIHSKNVASDMTIVCCKMEVTLLAFKCPHNVILVVVVKILRFHILI